MKDKLDEIKKYLKESKEADKKTMFLLFYAGHGEIIGGQQVLILNDLKDCSNKRFVKYEWYFKLENWINTEQSNFKESMFMVTIFACCRAPGKDRKNMIVNEKDQTWTDIEAEREQKINEHNDENKKANGQFRGEGEEFEAQFNFCKVYGCLPGSVVGDKNEFVKRLAQAFRMT